jgi:hypothetical protein
MADGQETCLIFKGFFLQAFLCDRVAVLAAPDGPDQIARP